MSYDEKETPDHLHADQDDVGGTDQPRFAEQQEETGEPGADIEKKEGDEGQTDAG